MALTDTAARKTQPREKPYKLADSGGLHLHIATGGYKSWRLKYRFGGKEKLLTFGAYTEVSVAEARDRRNASSATIAIRVSNATSLGSTRSPTPTLRSRASRGGGMRSNSHGGRRATAA